MYNTLSMERRVHNSSLDADVFQLGASSPAWRWRSCSSWRGFFAPVLISLLPSFHPLSVIRLHHSFYFCFQKHSNLSIQRNFKPFAGGWDELWQWTNWVGKASWKCSPSLCEFHLDSIKFKSNVEAFSYPGQEFPWILLYNILPRWEKTSVVQNCSIWMQVGLKMGLQLSVNGFLSARCLHRACLHNHNSLLGFRKGEVVEI